MKEMMNAAVLHAVGDLRYEQVPVPEVHEGEVLMKVMAAGVCAGVYWSVAPFFSRIAAAMFA